MGRIGRWWSKLGQWQAITTAVALTAFFFANSLFPNTGICAVGHMIVAGAVLVSAIGAWYLFASVYSKAGGDAAWGLPAAIFVVAVANLLASAVALGIAWHSGSSNGIYANLFAIGFAAAIFYVSFKVYYSIYNDFVYYSICNGFADSEDFSWPTVGFPSWIQFFIVLLPMLRAALS
jgi:hypothetical protein